MRTDETWIRCPDPIALPLPPVVDDALELPPAVDEEPGDVVELDDPDASDPVISTSLPLFCASSDS